MNDNVTVTIFNHPDIGEIASVVLDQDEFNGLCDDLKGIIVLNMDARAAEAQIDSLKAAYIIPMIARGTKTEFVFDRYKIKQQRMCVIVRGKGIDVMHNLTDKINEDNRKIAESN